MATVYIIHFSAFMRLFNYFFQTDEADQNKLRDTTAGRGLLYPDTFSEERLLFLPAATSVLLVLFSRNHNVCPR